MTSRLITEENEQYRFVRFEDDEIGKKSQKAQ